MTESTANLVAPHAVAPHAWTLLACFVIALVFFRSILPRLPRLIFRGRLRVRRAGLRGIQGIEWRSKGFVDAHPGLTLRVQHIYPVFRTWSRSAAFGEDGDARRPKAWLTVCVRGVGVRIPRGEAVRRSRSPPQPDKDDRLAGLMRDSSPRPTSSQTTSSAPLGQRLYWARALAARSSRRAAIALARLVLFVIVSGLPLVTSFVDVEVHRAEVYLEEPEAVVRVGHARAQLNMNLVQTHSAQATPCDARPQPASSLGMRDRVTGALSGMMPARLGKGARGFASYVRSGLPRGRATLTLEVAGVQVFEAKPAPSTPRSTSRPTSRGLFSQIATPTASTGFVPSAEWLSFSAVDERSTTDNSRWTGRWTDWALEPFPSAGFSSDPGWSERAAVPESARIVAMPGTTRIEVGLKIGASLELGAPESARLKVELAETIVGADALVRTMALLGRRKAERPREEAPSQSKAGPLLLKAVSSASVSIPLVKVSCELESPATDRCRLRTTLQGFRLVLKGSKPAEEQHRRWLGSCGTRTGGLQQRGPSAQGTTLRQGLARRFAWSSSPVCYVEHRRAFLVEAVLTSLETSLATKEGRIVKPSQLVSIGECSMRLRSTWTPFGVLPSKEVSLASSRRYFQGDPNELAVFVEASVGGIHGDVSLAHAQTLLASMAVARGTSSTSSAAPSHSSRPPPRLFAGVTLGKSSYRVRVDSSEDTAFVISLPGFQASAQGSWRDTYASRPEAERKAAWKALAKDELEWSLAADYRSDLPGIGSPKAASRAFRDARRASEVEENGPQRSMSMEEALIEMRERFGEQPWSGPTTQRRPVTPPHLRSRTAPQRKGSHPIRAPPQHDLAYAFEARAESDALQVHTVKGDAARHLFSLQTVGINATGIALGKEDHETGRVTLDAASTSVEATCSLEEIDIDLWHPEALKAVRDVLAAGGDDASPPSSGASPSPLSRIPIDASLFLSVGTIVAHIGGPDERCDKHMSRGVGFEAKRICLEATHAATRGPGRAVVALPDGGWGARSSLELPEDLRSSVATLATRHGQAAMVRLGLYEIGLFPLLDAESAGKDDDDEPESRSNSPPASPSVFAPAVWDFQRATTRKRTKPKFRQQDRSNFIFWMPFSATKVTVVPPGSTRSGKALDEVTVVTEGTRLLAFRIQLLHSYCVLVALATVRSLVPSRPKRSSPSRPLPSLSATIATTDIHVSVALPNDVNLFIHVRRLECRVSSTWQDISIGSEYLIAAVESARQHELWEEAARLRDWKVALKREGEGPPLVHFTADALSLRVPFQYPIHPIIDGAAVAFKATKQLVHQFLTGNADSVIYPVAEDPKHLPPIRIDLRILSIEMQDDPIETRLNLIWRAGGDENQARLERDATFAERMGGTNLKKQSTASLASTFTSSTEEDLTDDEHGPRVSAQQAREQLDRFNASSWIRRYINARTEQERREERMLRRIYGRYPMHRHSAELPIRLVAPQKAAPLFRSSMSRVTLEIDPPSFPMSDVRDFIHEQGKGVPKDLPYDLLIPFHLKWCMDEWRVDLRDYPIPLLHVPPISGEQEDGTRSWTLETDLVLAEHCGGIESIRHVPAVVVPAATGRPDAVEFGIDVPKMAMPVKIYGSPVVRVRTVYPTRCAWGHSMQPAISDVVRVFDSITSPPQDPSPKIGFWDKLPLLLHGRLHFLFEQGDFHLYLKGSRDPYHILGHGSGWVKCWRGNVEIRLGFDNKDREMLQFIANQYILAIPDLRDYIDRAAAGIAADKSTDEASHRSATAASSLSGSGRYAKDPAFRKICMKLTQGVRWGIGMRFERTCTDETCKRRPRCAGSPFYRECRFFDFKPHWDVHTRTNEYLSQPGKELERSRDTYLGWRSNHIHLSLSVCSPVGGDVLASAANNLYFTPLAWEHFWAWMRLFNGAMGLPIRQGRLFPAAEAASPKYGAHLGTIKYRFDIAPLFISHLYPQHLRSDYSLGATTLSGIKVRVADFHFDFHQRQQELVKEGVDGKPKKDFHKPFYEAEIDLSRIDLRTLAGQFREPNKRLVPGGLDEDDGGGASDMFEGKCTLDAEDSQWWDIDDWVEVNWQPPDDVPPKLRLVKTMESPRFNYYRRLESKREHRKRQASEAAEDGVTRPRTQLGPQNDDDDDDDHDGQGSRLEFTKFGSEGSHTCLVGNAPSPFKMQLDLSLERLHELEAEMQDASDPSIIGDLDKKLRLVKRYIAEIRAAGGLNPELVGHGATGRTTSPTRDEGLSLLSNLQREWGSFENRYFIHNPILFLSNQTRDMLLGYYRSSRQRRGAVHQLTARAVRYIREMAGRQFDESDADSDSSSDSFSPPPLKRAASHHEAGKELLRDLMEDTARRLGAEVRMPEADHANEAEPILDDHVDPEAGISRHFHVRRSDICNLMKPQIVLRSQVDPNATVILTALRLKLRNYAVNDPDAEEESVNERALYRNYFNVTGLQMFHPSDKCRFLHDAEDRNGFVYVPLETLIDVKYETSDFDRIISRTDAQMRYDKFNRLRLHDASKPLAAPSEPGDPETDHLVHHMDLICADCPRMGVLANSKQFGALYNVVTDLLLYRDPAYREHAKRLETMLFSYDFGDFHALADMVSALQVRVRHAHELHAQYHLHFDNLNQQGRLDFLALKLEIADMMDELSLIMEAIASYEDTNAAGSDRDKKSALRLVASSQDITWSMMGSEVGELLAKLSIRGVSFAWLNKADNSAANSLTIVDLSAVNVHPDALFPEIISKYTKVPDHPMAKQGHFVNAVWSVMAPVGGISIVDQFEFHLHPLRLQLELKVGRQIMDYIFGSKRERERRELEQRQAEKEEAERRAKESGVKLKGKGALARIAKGLHLGQSNKSPSSTPRGDESTPSGSRPASTDDLPSSVNRSRASSDRRSVHSRSAPAHVTATADDDDDNSEAGHQTIAAHHAAEMRSRAASNRTFVYVRISETVFCMSYKGDKQKSITDLYDLVFHAPTIEYRNRTWGYVDLTNHFKRDILRAAWGQKTSLIRGILNHRPRKLSLRQAQRSASPSSMAAGSPLKALTPRVQVDPPSPANESDSPEQTRSPESMLSELPDGDADEEEPSSDTELAKGAARGKSAEGPDKGGHLLNAGDLMAHGGTVTRFLSARLAVSRTNSGSGSGSNTSKEQERQGAAPRRDSLDSDEEEDDSSSDTSSTKERKGRHAEYRELRHRLVAPTEGGTVRGSSTPSSPSAAAATRRSGTQDTIRAKNRDSGTVRARSGSGGGGGGGGGLRKLLGAATGRNDSRETVGSGGAAQTSMARGPSAGSSAGSSTRE